MTGFNSKAIHVGNKPDPLTHAIAVPIYMTSTFEIVDKDQKFCYSRVSNPTKSALEENLASLEGAKYCVVSTSGLSACCLIMHLFKPKDHIICSYDLYGGITHYMNDMATNSQGLDTELVDLSSPEILLKLIKPTTRAVWLESPSNPILKVYDIITIAKICKEKNVLLIVDNTFMSPYLQNPLSLGADIVMHSCTKYIGGHADLLMGAVMTSNEDLYNKIKLNCILLGPTASPFDCYLCLRGVKTLGVRMDEAQENSMKLAKVLATHPKVEECIYPGLPSHPGQELLKKQAKGFGAMITIKVKGGAEAARKLCESVTVFQYAASLGGTESLMIPPYNTTHQEVSAETKKKLGITENMVRISVGIEDFEDLKDDILQALNTI